MRERGREEPRAMKRCAPNIIVMSPVVAPKKPTERQLRHRKLCHVVLYGCFFSSFSSVSSPISQRVHKSCLIKTHTHSANRQINGTDEERDLKREGCESNMINTL